MHYLAAVKLKLYAVAHTHRFGTDVRLVRSAGLPSTSEAEIACGIQFEKDGKAAGIRDGETIEVMPVDESNIPVIGPRGFWARLFNRDGKRRPDLLSSLSGEEMIHPERFLP
jgi:hypothetical protein